MLVCNRTKFAIKFILLEAMMTCYIGAVYVVLAGQIIC